MALGIINHLMLAVKDVKNSIEFYEPIMTFMDYELYDSNEFFALFRLKNGIGDFIIIQSSPELAVRSHERFSPGFHHVSFNADAREQVDDLYELLLRNKVEILDPPCECEEYSPGYYAVYFEDPDGMKLELSHTPNQKSR